MSTRELPRSATYPSPWCRIATCERPIDGNLGGPYCWTHRRTLRFSATLNDALSEFLSTAGGTTRPSKFNGNDVREAGELFAQGLARLFGAAFGTTVTVQPHPITPRSTRGRSGWHVALRWQEDEGQPTGYAPMDDEDEEPDDLEDDDAEHWEDDDR